MIKKLIRLSILFCISFFLGLSFAQVKCVPPCSSDPVYYYNYFVICYNDRSFCQQKKGINCWDFCSKYIGCNGPSGKIFYYPGDPNSGKEIVGSSQKTSNQDCLKDSLDSHPL